VSRRLQWPVLFAAVVLAAAGALTGGAVASTARVRVGATAGIPPGASVTGPRRAASPLRLTVALLPRDPAALGAAAEAVATPGSPSFRHYLTVGEFAGRYGAAPGAAATVAAALRAAGLSVGPPGANGLSLPVSGTTAAVERAFATKIDRVRLTSGRIAYANVSAPTLPAPAAASVQAVIGLSDTLAAVAAPVRVLRRTRSALRPAPRAKTDSGAPPCSAAQATGGYTANTIASAYDLSPLYTDGDQGAGQTVGVYELQAYSQADISAYETCYGVHTSVVPVSVDGGGAYTGGDDTEAALDIEQVIGIAPAATVRVYIAPDTGTGPYDVYSAMASDDAAKVITSSWGLCEQELSADGYAYPKAENSLFEEMALQGQSVLEASGDTGSAACAESEPSNTELSVGDPANSPFATGVGGSTLYTLRGSKLELWSPGQTRDEAVWNEGELSTGGSSKTPDATGGGVSTIYAMPPYQSGAPATLKVINPDSTGAQCAGLAPGAPYCRQLPDVSADGDPYFGYGVHVSTSSGKSVWESVGGSSAAAPLWAALMAVFNAQPTCRGESIGFANPSLYALAGADYAGYFHDVKVANPATGKANNDAVGTNGGLYPVTAGYDMTTGLGTPIAAALGAGLCALRAPVYTITYSVPSQSSLRDHKLTLRTQASDPHDPAIAYTASGLPSGLSMNSADGVISGTPSQIGVSAVTITAKDTDANSTLAHFTWTIFGAPRATGVRLSGVRGARPVLSFTLHAGAYAGALHAVAIALPRGLSFAARGRAVRRGLRVDVGRRPVRYRARVSHGVLTVTLRRAAGKLFIRVAPPTLRAGAGLVHRARGRRPGKVRLVLRPTDTQRRLSRMRIAVKLH
jgi:subtilase family serine protease